MANVVNIHEAKTHLSRIVDEIAAGAEVIIAKAGKPMALHRLAPAGLIPIKLRRASGPPVKSWSLDRRPRGWLHIPTAFMDTGFASQISEVIEYDLLN
ncbi:MAG: type II toxin-antitoxin system Phd/YefM family antitoxin [Gammaproteobacteria bacterium]